VTGKTGRAQESAAAGAASQADSPRQIPARGPAMGEGNGPDRAQRTALAARVAELAGSAGVHVAVAESLTGGMLSSALAEAPGASTWFWAPWWPIPVTSSTGSWAYHPAPSSAPRPLQRWPAGCASCWGQTWRWR
jgi:hypothetical protein